jgi:flagellin
MATPDLTRIAGNISALNALNALMDVNNRLAIAQTRLATGRRINSAAEDPAGLTIATKLDARSQGLKVALDALGDAKNVLSVAEGGLRKINDILVKIRNKAEAAVSDVMGNEERNAIYNDIAGFVAEIDDIVGDTTFNGTPLIGSGSTASNPLEFLADADGNTITFSLGTSHTAAALGITISGSAQVGSSGSAAAYLALVEAAITTVSRSLGTVGSLSARLDFKMENLTIAHANTEATFNRIMNANMAEELVTATKYAILQQTATAMLAQANAQPQFVLSLFR